MSPSYVKVDYRSMAPVLCEFNYLVEISRARFTSSSSTQLDNVWNEQEKGKQKI